MTHRVGIEGQVVIPKAIREQIGIEPGDEVTIEPDGREVRVRRVQDDRGQRAAGVKALRGVWAEAPGGGTEELPEDRRREREEGKAKRRGVGRPR